jgi:hypothetical protein
MPRHPSQGTGHGGPAKGGNVLPIVGGAASGKAKRGGFEAGNKAAAGRPQPGEGRAAMTDLEKAEFARAHIFSLITGAEHEMTQLNAANAFLDRVEGKPVARTELTGKDGAPVEMSQIRRVIVDPARGDV